MSRSAFAVLTLCLCSAAGFADPSPDQLSVVLFNNTRVELAIEVDSTTHEFVTLDTGQETRTPFTASQWINFGMIANQYVLPEHFVSYAGPATIYLQAEPDGSLYYIPPMMSFPISPPPEQPMGFPLKPVKVVDLT